MGAGGGGVGGGFTMPAINTAPAVDPQAAANEEERKRKEKEKADLAAAGAARSTRDSDLTSKAGASRAIGYVGAPSASSKRMLLGN